MKKLLFLFFLSFWSGRDDGYLIEMVLNLEEDVEYYAPKIYGDGLFFTASRIKTSNDGVGTWSSLYFSKYYDGAIVEERNEVLIKKKFNAGVADVCEMNGEVFFTVNSSDMDNENVISLEIHSGFIENGKVVATKMLNFCEKGYTYFHPTVSSDGKTLIFSSNIDGNRMRLFESKRSSTDNEWSEPNLISELTSDENIIFPNLINDSLLVFSTVMENGFGKYDIYKSHKYGGIWDFPENWKEINSKEDDLGVDMIDEKRGYFSSCRDYEAAKLYYFEIEN